MWQVFIALPSHLQGRSLALRMRRMTAGVFPPLSTAAGKALPHQLGRRVRSELWTKDVAGMRGRAGPWWEGGGQALSCPQRVKKDTGAWFILVQILT